MIKLKESTFAEMQLPVSLESYQTLSNIMEHKVMLNPDPNPSPNLSPSPNPNPSPNANSMEYEMTTRLQRTTHRLMVFI